jgi:hypothetical protein
LKEEKNTIFFSFMVMGFGIAQRGEFWEEGSFLNTQFWGKLGAIISIL